MNRSKHLVRTSTILSALVSAPLAALALPAGDTVVGLEQGKLLGADTAAGEQLGYAAAAAGDRAVLGAPRAYWAGMEAGAAYVFQRTGDAWTEEALLVAGDPEPFSRFGQCVAIAGDTAVVGAPDQDGRGAAYVFVHGGAGWVQEAKLGASDGAFSDRFGDSVSIASVFEFPVGLRRMIVVGAPGDDDGGSLSGSAYVFASSANGWGQTAKLTAADAQAQDHFGQSVSITLDASILFGRDQVAVGAFLGDGPEPDCGSAYVFERTGTSWVQVVELHAADAEGSDWFGRSVALLGTQALVVGAPKDGDACAPGVACESGSAYAFADDGTGWAQEAKLTASDAAPYQQFGWSLEASGPRAVIGAAGDLWNFPEPGAAYVYRRSNSVWAEEAKVVAGDALAENRFGYSVGISGTTVVSGAWQDSQAGPLAGAGYAHVLVEAFTAYCFGDGSGASCPCGNEAAPGSHTGCANSTGAGARLDGAGSTSAVLDDFTVLATGLIPAQPVLLFAGDDALDGGNGQPFGDGLRCAGGSVVRLGVQSADLLGEAGWGPGLGATAGWVPGEVRRMQAWHRDPLAGPCGSGFNLTNGLEVVFAP